MKKTKVTYYIITPYRSKGIDIRKIIHSTLKGIGLERKDVTKDGMSVSLFYEIKRLINEADIIIADLTDFNPNVMYEIGIAHANKKPTLLVIKEGFEIMPSNLFGNIVLIYDPDDLESFQKEIRNFALKHINRSDEREKND